MLWFGCCRLAEAEPFALSIIVMELLQVVAALAALSSGAGAASLQQLMSPALAAVPADGKPTAPLRRSSTGASSSDLASEPGPQAGSSRRRSRQRQQHRQRNAAASPPAPAAQSPFEAAATRLSGGAAAGDVQAAESPVPSTPGFKVNSAPPDSGPLVRDEPHRQPYLR